MTEGERKAREFYAARYVILDIVVEPPFRPRLLTADTPKDAVNAAKIFLESEEIAGVTVSDRLWGVILAVVQTQGAFKVNHRIHMPLGQGFLGVRSLRELVHRRRRNSRGAIRDLVDAFRSLGYRAEAGRPGV